MKIFKTLILLTFLAGIALIAELLKEQSVEELVEQPVIINIDNHYSNSRTVYDIEVKYIIEDNSFNVSEVINWKNIDSQTVDSLYLSLPSNNRESNDDYSYLTYKINSFMIDGKPAHYEFVNNMGKNFLDSTLIKLILQQGIVKDEIVSFEINYTINFYKDKNFSDAHLYNFENWYVTISPYLNGDFYKYPLHKFIEPFLEYSDYNVEIKIPKEFDISTSGKVVKEISNNSVAYSCSAKKITRFNWFAFNELSKYSREINLGGKSVNISLFIKESKDGYVERYFDATEKYLNSLLEYALYPFESLAIVDLSNVNNVQSKSYPNLIGLESDLISPIKTQKLEYKLAYLITEQYFENILTSNYMSESWLSKGIAAYIAEKLVRTHFGELNSYFNVADYYPIYGLHFMSFAGIPLIYTIGEHDIPEGARYIDEYYNNLTFADLSIPTYQLPTFNAYKVSSIVKPQIALLTMEKYIGAEKLKNNLRKYFSNNLSRYKKSSDFTKIMSEDLSKENRELCFDLFSSDKIFDYAINYIEKRDGNKYDIMVERIGSGVTPVKLSVNRGLDTLQINWNGKEKYKIFTINSDSEIISAEIDTEKKNMLDLNFANNSYIVEEQYWGTISYATRVFFWFQNALMLIGGKG